MRFFDFKNIFFIYEQDPFFLFIFILVLHTSVFFIAFLYYILWMFMKEVGVHYTMNIPKDKNIWPQILGTCYIPKCYTQQNIQYLKVK